MLVLYEGLGEWCYENFEYHGRDFDDPELEHELNLYSPPYEVSLYKAEVNGLFRLQEKDALTLRLKGEVTVTQLDQFTGVYKGNKGVLCTGESCDDCRSHKYNGYCKDREYNKNKRSLDRICKTFQNAHHRIVYFKLLGPPDNYRIVKNDDGKYHLHSEKKYPGKVYTPDMAYREPIPVSTPTQQVVKPKKPHGNTEINAKKRKEILDAAVSVLEKYPEQCKAKNGNIKGAKITEKIEEQSYEFWPNADSLEPPLGHDAIVRLVNKAIKDGIITLKNVE